ncbi:MAG: glycosyltransferase family 39 protein [Dehalococcoidia bacterium]
MASRDEAAEVADSGPHAAPVSAAPANAAATTGLIARTGLTTFDIVTIVTLTAFTAAMRLWRLDSVPLGLHGDEAWTGLDARRILDEGWIGVYVDSALGQPTGPIYFAALLFTFLPETTFTVRFSMALLGIATIPLAYLAFSRMFNRTVGVFGAVILAVMTWHLHLGRTGFMVISWPFMEVAVLLALWLAFKHRRPELFVLAGSLTGLGVYTYNAYLLFVPVAFVPVAWMLFEQRNRTDRLRALYLAFAFAAVALLFALPLLRFMQEDSELYERHQRVVGVTHSEGWDDGSLADKADVLWDRAREWHNGLILGDRPDQGDGMAEFGLPPVEPVIYFLALAGLGIAIWNIRRKEYAVCVAAVLILPWGALLTVNDGLFRRTLGLAPFLALLAAIPLAMLWDVLRERRRDVIGVAGMALVAAVPAYAGAQATYDYFGPAQDTFTMRVVYPYQLEAATEVMDDLPRDTYIYFYSDRWRLTYETVRFLAPDVVGEDRSREYGSAADMPDSEVRYDIDREGRVAFVVMGDYLRDMDRIMRTHRGGRLIESTRDDEVLFRAYVLE